MELTFNADSIMSAIQRECDLAVKDVDGAIEKAGEAALAYLRENSPVDEEDKPRAITKGPNKGKLTGSSGRYRDGWTIKKGSKQGVSEVTVYNADCYQLTHLLEHGHLAKNGKVVQPVVHIAKAEETASEVLDKELGL